MRRSVRLKISSPKGRYYFKGTVRVLNNNEERFQPEPSGFFLDWGKEFPKISDQELEKESSTSRLYLFQILVTKRGRESFYLFPEFKANSFREAINLLQMECLKVVARKNDILIDFPRYNDGLESLLHEGYKIKVL